MIWNKFLIILRLIEYLLGIFFLIGLCGAIDDFTSLDFWLAYVFLAILIIAPLVMFHKILKKKIANQERNSLTTANEFENESNVGYVESRNVLYRVDGQCISDSEIPYLMQAGLEERMNPSPHISVDLTEPEQHFFDELKNKLSEINRSITIERLSNGVISVYSNMCYVGKIKLSGRKHWMQILRGETQSKTVYGELDDFIQYIPDWVRYIRLHCH